MSHVNRDQPRGHPTQRSLHNLSLTAIQDAVIQQIHMPSLSTPVTTPGITMPVSADGLRK